VKNRKGCGRKHLYPTGICLEGPRKIIKTFFKDDLSLGQDLSWGSHEYEPDLLGR